MRRLWVIPAGSVAIALCLAQGPRFEQAVQPVLARNCSGCHNPALRTANLDLTVPTQPRETWDKVRGKLVSGKMPPPGFPAPSGAERAAVLAWIDQQIGVRNMNNPGRVTARRLNRVEYDNTIRDLLGVAVRPAEEFPVDDSGYGFDNIGDVLTVSPMLMEKYAAAAERVSRVAIYGESYPEKPTRLIRLINRRSQGSYDVLEGGTFGTWMPYSLRGAMYGSWTFPVDGEYEFRLRIANFRAYRQAPDDTPAARPRAGRRSRTPPAPEELRAREERVRNAAPPRQLVLTLDGAPVITEVVEGSTEFGYSRGEFVSRVPVKAGLRAIRASYPELADLADPRENINPDMRRALFVDYLDIVGPFQPSKAPPGSYGKVFVCGHAPGGHAASCARQVVESLTRRAYRRPVSAQEVDAKLRLVGLAQREGDSLEEGVRLALQAILMSPDFLFHVERDTPGPAARELDPNELASRLSYFLWSSMPDAELFRLADANRLTDAAVLAGQVRRMLADPKARNLTGNFAAQWLQLRSLGRTMPDPVRFPTVDDELLGAMRTETKLFVEAVIREDRSILDFIDAPFTYLNGPLARHYGIEGVEGEQFRRVDVDPARRGGLLTQGAILTVSSYPTRTSPPVRGKWVLENLLGTPPPPPPANVPALDEANLGKTVSLRERLEQHRKDPNCAACHNLMDPIGFGLESYNAVGSWRTHDGGVLIDTSGTLPDGRSFQGATGLKEILRSRSEAFTRNLAEKLLTFALGRGLESYDAPAVNEIVGKVTAEDYRFSALVHAIVNSRPFRMRAGEGEAK